MKRYFNLASFCIVFLLAVSTFASANSNDSFSGATLIGVSGTASGQFTFSGNGSAGTFSNLSIAFNGGVFAGNGASNGGGQAICAGGWCGFGWQTTLGNGDKVWNLIAFNPSSGQFQEWGGISNSQYQGGFDYLSVAEGGATLSYLMLSALAIFGGIFLSGKRRRSTGSPVHVLAHPAATA
ncbi:MAG TPA: hypothetical protein VNZ03_30055 [Terriglobales bacterium]|nr:hypothetical protein [Terriglobales bacterium]